MDTIIITYLYKLQNKREISSIIPIYSQCIIAIIITLSSNCDILIIRFGYMEQLTLSRTLMNNITIANYIIIMIMITIVMKLVIILNNYTVIILSTIPTIPWLLSTHINYEASWNWHS